MATTAVITVLVFLPFLPGRYDSLAISLSGIAQVAIYIGMLLVPVGLLWLASRFWIRRDGAQYGFGITALIVTTFECALLSVGAFSLSGPLLAVASLAVWGFAFSRILPRLKLLKSAPSRPISAAPLYMVFVPVSSLIALLTLGDRVTEYSRSRAIANSSELIADIERYRAANGRYPVSLLSLRPDYNPGLIGIREYRYEPKGEAYNLVFKHASLVLGTDELVVYNPLDEQAVTSHRLDLLQLTPAQLLVEQTRGHYAVHDAGHPHWKYFLFD